MGSVGKTVAGKYALSRLLGEGGMGAVYEAEHLEIGKRVAIKIVRDLRGQKEEAAARFIREARAASAVESDHIVQVFDVGQDPDLGLYMVMELLAGEDLGKVISRVGKLSSPLACAIADQAASALVRAHQAGVIHRDLKPENVFLRARDDGSALVKLVDFGIAKVVREVRSAAAGDGIGAGAITRSGSILGSPCYMSPEQAQGLPEVDHRTDVYSLGAVLYEMLTGKRAFAEKATYEQTIVPIITQTAPRVSASVKTIAPSLDQLVADMMNPAAEHRPSDMREVRRRLAKIQPGVDETRIRLPVVALPAGATSQPGPRTHAAVVTDRSEAETVAASVRLPLVHMNRTMIYAGIGLVTLVGFVIGWAVVGRHQPVAEVPSAEPAAIAASDARAAPSIAPVPTAAASASAAPSAEPSAAPAVSVTPAESATASAATAKATASAKSRPAPGPRPPARPSDQVGGVGITTAF